jgi:hypothetical protein
MRRFVAAAVAAGLFTLGAQAPARADDSAVTKDKVEIGVSYVDLAAVRAAGVNRDHGDYDKAASPAPTVGTTTEEFGDTGRRGTRPPRPASRT